jgi:hypothetical protein
MALALVVASGCSSSGSNHASPTTTVRTDPASTVAAFCTASKRLTALGQTTGGAGLSDVAANIVELRAIAHQFATHPPPSIAGPTKRYAVVIEAVADALSLQSSSGSSPPRQLSLADTAALSRYRSAHCPTV